VKKTRTLEQVATAKARAVNFLSNVLEDDDRADEVEEESLESYAERRGIQILENPSGRGKQMPTITKPELEKMLDEVAQLAGSALDPASSRRQLVDALQAIYNIAGPDDEDEDEEIDEDDDDEDDSEA
jgi:hypothetical protein